MEAPFKFRYVSEIAGSFVIISLAMLIGSIFVAGHHQGWFEGKFVIRAQFKTEEGTFGLQEGNEVRIMNTVAGRVGKIMPNETGTMEASFIILRRFHPYVRRDSVAYVKKKFGLAGDAFVEITRGSGPEIVEGGIIKCAKDKELIETLQNLLEEVADVVFPMLDQFQELLIHANGIATSLEEERGIAGSMLNDGEFATDIKDVIANLNDTLLESREMLRETSRLVKAAQKNWLFRKHVEKDDNPRVAAYLSGGTSKRAVYNVAAARLKTARATDNQFGVAESAYNIAVCLMIEGDYEQAHERAREARHALKAVGKSAAHTHLLESEIYRREDRTKEAYGATGLALEILKKFKDKDQCAEAYLAIANLFCDANDIPRARSNYAMAKSQVRRSDSLALKAIGARVLGCILSNEGSHELAAEQFDLESTHLRDCRLYEGMVSALKSAAIAHELAGSNAAAADRYFRAGRSLLASGDEKRATELIQKAMAPATLSGDSEMIGQIEAIADRISNNKLQTSSDEAPAMSEDLSDRN